MFKTRLDIFENTFWHFWNFENIFFENFRSLDIPWKTGQKIFSKNLTQNKFETRLDTFGNNFGQFWNFANFLIFLKSFEDLTFHGKLGKNFSKSLPQNMFKTRLDTFENTFGHFWNFEKKFFSKIFENSTLHGTLGKKNFRKI